MKLTRAGLTIVLGALVATASPASPQSSTPNPPPLRKIGEMELGLTGLSATLDPPNPTVPKNIASGVRVRVRAGGADLLPADVARFVGAGFQAMAELSGPGLPGTVTLPAVEVGAPATDDPLFIPLPPLAVAGDYT